MENTKPTILSKSDALLSKPNTELLGIPQEWFTAIWWDIEPYYVAEGWTVTFHKADPGSTESSYYTFK